MFPSVLRFGCLDAHDYEASLFCKSAESPFLLWVVCMRLLSQTNGHFVLKGLFLRPGRLIGHKSKQMFLTEAAELTLTGCGLTTNAAPCDLTRPQFELCIRSLTTPVFVNTTVLPVPHAAAVTLHLRVLIHALHSQSSGF